MTVTGIIAEFNPFHNGHQYLLEQAQGLKIVAMSGNFVQRGEPALLDKWVRTQMALESGADLVVELPFLVAVQSADYFAQGAVDLLARLGVDTLTFGTESQLDYNQIRDIYAEKSSQMEAFLDSLPDKLSYPQKTQAMWEAFAGIQFSGHTPNHILALAYSKAASQYGLKLQPVERQGAGYHSTEKEVAFASATSLRQHREDKDFVAKFMPNAELLATSPQVTWDNYFNLLRYQILTHPKLSELYQVNDELANRIKTHIHGGTNLEDLVHKVATKRYTKARVRRVLTYILVQARESDLPKAIHILGFSQKGQAHLKTIKKSVPLISRIGKDPWDSLTQQADQVYQLGHPQLKEQNWGRLPVRKETSLGKL